MGVSALFQSPVSSWPLFEISSIGYHLALLLFWNSLLQITLFLPLQAAQTSYLSYFLVHLEDHDTPSFFFC